MMGYVQLAHGLCGALLLVAAEMPVEAPVENLNRPEKPGLELCTTGSQLDQTCFKPFPGVSGSVDLLDAFRAFGANYDEHNRLRRPGSTFTRAEVRRMAAGIAVSPRQRAYAAKAYSKLLVHGIDINPKEILETTAGSDAKPYSFIVRLTFAWRKRPTKDYTVVIHGRVDFDPDFASKIGGLDPAKAERINEDARRALHIESVSGRALNSKDARALVGPAVLAHLYFTTFLPDVE